MRKNIITYVVSLLTLVVVAAGALIGFGDDLSMTAEAAAIKAGDVDEDILHVKCQTNVTGNEGSQTADLRMVSSIDSLEYDAVGFEVYFLKDDNGTASVYKWFENQTTKVFEKIETKTEGLEYTFSPQIFSVDSQYFMTYTITGIDDDKFDDGILIKPFAMEEGANGARVYGRSKYTTINDMENKNLYIAVKGFENVDVDNISVSLDDETVGTYSGTENLEVEYVNGSSMSNAGCGSETNTVDKEKGLSDNYTHIKISDSEYDGESLKSVTTFTVTTGGGDSTGETGTMTHRNLHYTREENEEITPDTTWYDSNQTKFVIVTEADLYGLADLGKDKNGVNFSGKTVYLAGDIEVNSSESMSAARTAIAGGDLVTGVAKWTPIGAGKHFNGRFLGQGHAISGLYYNDETAENVGLFGITAGKCEIDGVRLFDSYFSGKQFVGSLVGRINGGTFANLYSDADIVAASGAAGGLIGRFHPGTIESEVVATITKSWFEGTVKTAETLNEKQQWIGGIIGKTENGSSSTANSKLIVTDCLNTGDITSSKRNNTGTHCAAGIVGGLSANTSLEMSNCLNTGNVTYPSTLTSALGLGDILGITDSNCVVAIKNCFTTETFGRISIKTKDTFSYENDGKDVTFDSNGRLDSGTTASPIVEAASINGDDISGIENVLTGFDFENNWCAKASCYPVPAGLKDLQKVLP